MTTAAHIKKCGDLEYYIDYHQQLIQSALVLRKTCPTCEDEGCHYKCSKCHSVTYCSKKCQISDWPKHKRICQIFSRYVKVFQGVKKEVKIFEDLDINVSYDGVLNWALIDALVSRFYMHGIEPERTCIFLHYYPIGDTPWLLPSIAIQGKIYDVLSFTLSCQFGEGKPMILPIPGLEKLELHLKLDLYEECYKYLVACHNQQGLPWSVPTDIDEKDRDLVIKHATSTKIAHFYFWVQYYKTPCHRPNLIQALLDLYGDDVIQWASGKSRKEFLRDITSKTLLKSAEEAFEAWAKCHREKWYALRLKKDTRDKCLFATESFGRFPFP